MVPTRIKFAYRQVIGMSGNTDFERTVFNDTFREFSMQAQVYNPDKKFRTLHELIQNNPKANSLHYKVGFSIGLYVKELKDTISGLFDMMDRSVSFSTHRFEIIESDILDKSKHRVAILYESGPVTLLGIVSDFLILTKRDKLSASLNEPVDVFMLRLQPGLSIIQWQEGSSIN